jgi:2-isopropylmalate synthase
VHCHDDLGMAVANSLMAVVTGARQVECTLNGIGERAGNCPLEEVVMALKTREAFFHVRTGIDTARLYPASRLLANITGMVIPRNKAVVGENAFAGESPVQPALLGNRGAYGLMRPQDVGLSRSDLALGKYSDEQALRERVGDLGFQLDEAQFSRVLAEFKALAERKRDLFDGDIESLVLRAEGAVDGPWTLVRLATAADSGEASRATVKLRHVDGREIQRDARGDGPVDAAFQALEAATGVQATLRQFELRSLSAGEDAQGEALVVVEYGGRSYRGASVSTDIVEAATRAFLEVINRIELAARPPGAGPASGADACAGLAKSRTLGKLPPRYAALEQERTQ